jgi:NAD(P)-dependent dehydrogenase (short-subunit alcohol dehydrogenase family)
VTRTALALEVESMLKYTIEAFGRLDYAVNNAGIDCHLLKSAPKGLVGDVFRKQLFVE